MHNFRQVLNVACAPLLSMEHKSNLGQTLANCCKQSQMSVP